MKKFLKVMASEETDALFSNLEALLASPPSRRYVGWKFNAEVGEAGGWERKEEPETLPYRHEYVKAVREGDLVPADKETAKLCGVIWCPRQETTSKKKVEEEKLTFNT